MREHGSNLWVAVFDILAATEKFETLVPWILWITCQWTVYFCSCWRLAGLLLSRVSPLASRRCGKAWLGPWRWYRDTRMTAMGNTGQLGVQRCLWLASLLLRACWGSTGRLTYLEFRTVVGSASDPRRERQPALLRSCLPTSDMTPCWCSGWPVSFCRMVLCKRQGPEQPKYDYFGP